MEREKAQQCLVSALRPAQFSNPTPQGLATLHPLASSSHCLHQAVKAEELGGW